MKKVVITGGNGDIAMAIRELLLSEGEYEVYSPAKEELDVTNLQECYEYFSRVKPDILINNAGFVKVNNIAETDINLEVKSININLVGTFNCTNCVLKINKDALVINVGSSAGTKVHGGWSSYCASKAAVIMATKCWAEEGVRTVCVSPGRTATKMRTSLFQNEDRNTLLEPDMFAKVVLNAIKGKFKFGSNVDVNVSNYKELI